MPAPLPEWTDPLVYLTLGTAFGTRKVLQTILAGLAALPVDVIVASGKIRLDVVPDNVIAREWVPQAQLLPHASVVVHHGGSGTTLGALAAGVPQLVLPQGADQFTNATALTEAGAALRLLPEELTTTAVADAVRTLLPHKGNDHRDAARAIAAEIAGMPAPEDVARTLPDYT
jgi:MGT family glycosyltransferase